MKHDIPWVWCLGGNSWVLLSSLNFRFKGCHPLDPNSCFGSVPEISTLGENLAELFDNIHNIPFLLRGPLILPMHIIPAVSGSREGLMECFLFRAKYPRPWTEAYHQHFPGSASCILTGFDPSTKSSIGSHRPKTCLYHKKAKSGILKKIIVRCGHHLEPKPPH